VIDEYLRQQAQEEFQIVRNRANTADFFRMITGKARHLRGFEVTQEALSHRLDLGLQTINLQCITCSLDRDTDFDVEFRPRVNYLRERWVQIDLAYTRGEYLPPIEVYKLGDEYYVRDGHHRVSVMRYHGQEFVDAYVTEIDQPCWN
jgi:hypothetical protein